MRVDAARAVAVGWVRERMRADPSVEGALFSGSTVGLPGDAQLPVWSDVDVLLVRDSPGVKVGKFVHRGVLLEVSSVTWAEVGEPEDVLGSWVFAPMFRTDAVIADPSGRLAAVRRRVAVGFADPVWVRRRCAGVRRRIENGLRGLDAGAPLAEQVLAWVFPTSLVAVWPAVAGLVDPTVRRRFVRASEVLTRFGFGGRYPELLAAVDGGGVGAERVREHLVGLAVVFDEVARLPREGFAFGADLAVAGRPVVFEGGAALVAAGRHREAMFWVVVTYARCLAVLGVVAPERERVLRPGLVAVLADLQVVSAADRRRRADAVLASLPGWQSVVDAIVVRAVAG
ncbi:hypothetical protein [Micromonospora sp. RP3T]|uniref:hypothetical protein n=1 Tax=Micromonospora sp. RP3T TaxID=2135446 RepID=UPI000D176A89|nr:hypothetical protein [Micromonospora sp. RP3T]PTA44977.1 hypothetical protein C8054_17455 [Micromonospora sp. RP3T]